MVCAAGRTVCDWSEYQLYRAGRRPAAPRRALTSLARVATLHCTVLLYCCIACTLYIVYSVLWFLSLNFRPIQTCYQWSDARIISFFILSYLNGWNFSKYIKYFWLFLYVSSPSAVCCKLQSIQRTFLFSALLCHVPVSCESGD